ncbi:MAG TPA: triose-phosphate isomerase [Terriglobia bacterium]|nr:triose-phosphate isomerase [Terriglobia bacterium]
MRRPVIAGNWKMYKTVKEAVQFVEQLRPLIQHSGHCDVVVAPPFTALSETIRATRGSNIAVSAQDLYWEKEGAFTGEISPSMLADVGCAYTIIGHSERRQFFGETNHTVNRKIRAALGVKLIPIVCVGETLAEREADQTHKVIETQCSEGLAGLTVDDFSRIIVAYEPVWAIGTGRTATPDIAAEAHLLIRELARKFFGEDSARNLRILYGGSVKPDNIKGLMAQEDIDGALVGGASLKVESFAALVNY